MPPKHTTKRKKRKDAGISRAVPSKVSANAQKVKRAWGTPANPGPARQALAQLKAEGMGHRAAMTAVMRDRSLFQ